MIETAEIVGREEELELLRDRLAASDGPRVLLVEGDPGIGKTTVLNAARRFAEASDRRVLAARPAPGEAVLSFSVIHDLLEPVLDEVLGALPPPQRRALTVALLLEEPEGKPPDRRAVSLAVLGALRTVAQPPALLIVDDVQWLDAPSAAVLEFALRRLTGEGLVMLAAARTNESLPLDLTRDLAPERIKLRPLSLGALHRLLVSRLGLALPRPTLIRIEKASGGNPFYALELGRLLARGGGSAEAGRSLPIPDDLAELTWRRLATLPPRTRADLAVVAALAAPTMRIVEAASPGAQRRLARVIEEGVLADEASRLRFAHPLLAETLLERLDVGKRRAIHRRLAGLVEAPEERARHLALSVDQPDEEVAAAVDAAARTVANRSPDAAAQLYELASRLSPTMDSAAERTIAAADQLIGAGDPARARAALERVVEQVPPSRLRARAFYLLANAREDDLAQAAAFAERARTEAESEGDLATLADAHCYLAWTTSLAGDVERGFDHARAAKEVAESLPDRHRLVDALTVLGTLEVTARNLRTTALERAVELDDGLGERPRSIHYRNPRAALGRRWLYDDRLDEGRVELLAAYRTCVARGDFFERPQILFYLGELELLAGRWNAARAAVEEGHDIAQQLALEQTELSLLGGLARLDAHAGDVELARSRALRALVAGDATGDAVFTVRALAVLGFLELSLGDAEQAAHYLRDAVERARMRTAAYFRLLPDAIEAEAAVDRNDHGAALLQLLEAESTPWAVATSHRCRGLIAAASGDLALALDCVEEALVAHDRLPMPFELGRTLLVRGAVLRRARRKADARASLSKALELFEQLGARLWTAKARAEIARIGGRAREPGLTPTERRVAGLAAAGKTNKHVAADLFVTVNTVEAHLKRVYDKLGIRSRAMLGSSLANQEGEQEDL